MTLDTKIFVKADTTARDLNIALANALLTAHGSEDTAHDVVWRENRPKNGSVLGQGLPAIIGNVTDRHADSGCSWCGRDASEGTCEDGDPHSHMVPDESMWETSLDTAYGYNHNGMGCTMLHAVTCLHLLRALPEGSRVWAVDEYRDETGDIRDAVFLQQWLSGGNDASQWFKGFVDFLGETGAVFRA